MNRFTIARAVWRDRDVPLRHFARAMRLAIASHQFREAVDACHSAARRAQERGVKVRGLGLAIFVPAVVALLDPKGERHYHSSIRRNILADRTRVEQTIAQVKKRRKEMRALVTDIDGALSRQAAARTGGSTLTSFTALLPVRVGREDLGDLLEDLEHRHARGATLLELRARIVTGLWWLLVASLKEVASIVALAIRGDK